ncbi:hypothetical protein Sjap_017017 [Stephania japonica]|uniref:Uncharacterized protein n=1 Tax=Stephania japonica TaxID=461633 RepID=A0AAP0I5D6_9MAGN
MAEGDDVLEAMVSSIASGQCDENENPDYLVGRAIESKDLWEAIVASSRQDNQNESILSSEEIAWVDSCFVKEAELSDGDWNVLKEALLDIISSSSSEPAQSSHVTTAESSDFARGADDNGITEMEIGDEAPAQVTGGTDEDLVGASSEVRITEYLKNIIENGENDQFAESTVRGQLHNYLRNEKPNFRESDVDADGSSSLGVSNEGDFLSESIFRVWDLETSLGEEDDDVKLLENALAESSSTDLPSMYDYAPHDTEKENLDNLIAYMADLSLNSFTDAD